jgi:hypothetical protein
VAVRDIAIHPRDNDIIVATHGRGIYILDDAAPLQQLQSAVKTDAYLFPIRPAIRWAGGGSTFRSNERDWIAPNPAAGAWIDVYLREAPAQPVTIAIADKAGKPVRTLRAKGEAGVNRFAWNLRYDLPGERPAPQAATPAEPPAGRFGGGPQGPAVNPGDYAVKVTAGGRELTGQVTVRLGPGVEATAADLDAQLQAAFSAVALQRRVTAVVERVDSLLAQLAALDAQAGRQAEPPGYKRLVSEASSTIKAFRDEELARPVAGLGYRQYPRLREDVQSLVGYFNRGFRKPNEGELTRMKDLSAAVEKAEARLKAIEAGEIARVNEALRNEPRIK